MKIVKNILKFVFFPVFIVLFLLKLINNKIINKAKEDINQAKEFEDQKREKIKKYDKKIEKLDKFVENVEKEVYSINVDENWNKKE